VAQKPRRNRIAAVKQHAMTEMTGEQSVTKGRAVPSTPYLDAVPENEENTGREQQ
jgi:hypothetical protein